MAHNNKVLFMVPYPLHRAPSQRFRVELFLPVLNAAEIDYKIASFLDEKTWQVLYINGSPLQKAWGVIKGFILRLWTVLFVVPGFEYVFIHREASPIGPPIFEFIAAKLLGKKIIYDFDDAIWIPNTSSENKMVSWLKAFWKIKYICKWAHTVVGGNQYLCNYAKQYNRNVVLIPTCVDTDVHKNKSLHHSADRIKIGWTGSHSTMQYLNEIVPILSRINKEFGTETIIISNKAPEFQLDNMKYIQWKETTEVEDLSQIDIGIMPLEADPWCEGKCGFKLIQYMALGMPAVASPVGVNRDIIENGVNGFLCESDIEWYNALATLIQNSQMRKSMGEQGRNKIERCYSIQANAGAFVGLFK